MLLVINEKACIGLLNNDQYVQVCQPVKKLEQFLKSLVSLGDMFSFKRFSEALFSFFTFWCDATADATCIAAWYIKPFTFYQDLLVSI